MKFVYCLKLIYVNTFTSTLSAKTGVLTIGDGEQFKVVKRIINEYLPRLSVYEWIMAEMGSGLR